MPRLRGSTAGTMAQDICTRWRCARGPGKIGRPRSVSARIWRSREWMAAISQAFGHSYDEGRRHRGRPYRHGCHLLLYANPYTNGPRLTYGHSREPEPVINCGQDNRCITPDLGPCEVPSARYVSDWQSLPYVHRHLHLCAVSLHKAIRRRPPVSNSPHWLERASLGGPSGEDIAVFYRHQACAVRILQEQLRGVSQACTDSKFFSSLLLLLSSCIQYSAYSSWSVHLTGAKALLRLWGERSFLDTDNFSYFVFMVTDIYGTTMTGSHGLSTEVIQQHKMYLEMLPQLNVDIYNTLTPIPHEIIISTISVNIRRAALETSSRLQETAAYGIETSVAEIIAHTTAFDPEAWAGEVVRRQSSQLSRVNSRPHSVLDIWDQKTLESWNMLARSFQCATILYAILSDNSCHACYNQGDPWDEERSSAYLLLVDSIQTLFSYRCEGSSYRSHYKFVLWPMVVVGVEAAIARHDKNELDIICSHLSSLAVELGAMAMHDAAVFLEQLWARCGDRYVEEGITMKVDWKRIFRDAPIFLM